MTGSAWRRQGESWQVKRRQRQRTQTKTKTKKIQRQRKYKDNENTKTTKIQRKRKDKDKDKDKENTKTKTKVNSISTQQIGTIKTPGVLDDVTGIPVAVLGNKVHKFFRSKILQHFLNALSMRNCSL